MRRQRYCSEEVRRRLKSFASTPFACIFQSWQHACCEPRRFRSFAYSWFSVAQRPHTPVERMVAGKSREPIFASQHCWEASSRRLCRRLGIFVRREVDLEVLALLLSRRVLVARWLCFFRCGGLFPALVLSTRTLAFVWSLGRWVQGPTTYYVYPMVLYVYYFVGVHVIIVFSLV